MVWPAASGIEKELYLTSRGLIQYHLKIPCRDDISTELLIPINFIARFETLALKPGANLIHYHGVFLSIVFFIRHVSFCTVITGSR